MILALLILISAFLLNLFLPWWSIAIPGLLFGYILNKKSGASFGWGFVALFVLWGGQAFYIHVANDGILSTRIAEMLGVGSPLIVIFSHRNNGPGLILISAIKLLNESIF